jgi:hypothetical protein
MSAGVTTEDSTLGILDPAAGLRRFELRRHSPAPDLAPLVDWHWIVRWSLEDPFEQEMRTSCAPTGSRRTARSTRP